MACHNCVPKCYGKVTTGGLEGEWLLNLEYNWSAWSVPKERGHLTSRSNRERRIWLFRVRRNLHFERDRKSVV